MARSRARAPRPRKDWTFHEQSYTSVVSTLASGVATGIAFPLTVSQNTRGELRRYGFNTLPVASDYISGAAFPDGANNPIYAVDVSLVLNPSTWNVGDAFKGAFRLLHEEQEPRSGDMLTSVDYSLWVNVVGGEHISQWANSGFLREKRINIANIAGTAITSSGAWMLNMRWRSRKGLRLGNSRALFLYCESASGSVQMRIQPFCRVLQGV